MAAAGPGTDAATAVAAAAAAAQVAADVSGQLNLDKGYVEYVYWIIVLKGQTYDKWMNIYPKGKLATSFQNKKPF